MHGEAGREREELIGADRAGLEAVFADDSPVARGLLVNLPEQSMRRLKPEPFQAVRPELRGVGGQEDESAGAGDADAFTDHGLRIDVEGGQAVLDADNYVERAVAKAQGAGVHLQKSAIRHVVQELRA